MNLSERKSVRTAIAILGAALASGWSLGAIGLGIWQLSQSRASNPNVANFARVPDVATGVFNYGGSTSWAALRLAVDSVIQAERPEIQFRYVQPENEPPGSSPGIKMLLEGRLAFVQSADALNPQEYELAKQQGLTLKQVPVAVDSIAVAVHPRLALSGLTLEQLRQIYTGEISNWREVGGADLPITVYSRPPSTGDLVNRFKTKILQNRQFSSQVEFVPTTTQALRKLANNPGAIYYDSTAAMILQCSAKLLPLGLQSDALVAPYQPPLVPASQCPQKRNRLNVKALQTARYPLTHYLYVVFIENEAESPIGRAYANFLLTPQGQKLIARTGFVPLD